jgi:hypothetical protein
VLEARRALGIAALLAHEPQVAAEHLRSVWEHTVREGIDEPGAFPVAPELVGALAELGELTEAQAVAGRLRELAEEQEHPWGLAAARRCAALLRLPDDADALAEAAGDYERLGLRGDAAHTLLALGRGLRRHRKWGVARDALERAAAAFDALDSPGWADEVRSAPAAPRRAAS